MWNVKKVCNADMNECFRTNRTRIRIKLRYCHKINKIWYEYMNILNDIIIFIIISEGGDIYVGNL